MLKTLEGRQMVQALPTVSLLLLAFLITSNADAAGGDASRILNEADRAYHQGNLQQSLKLYEAAGDPKELYVVDGCGHSEAHVTGGAEYERRVLAFLARHLEGASSAQATAAAEAPV